MTNYSLTVDTENVLVDSELISFSMGGSTYYLTPGVGYIQVWGKPLDFSTPWARSIAGEHGTVPIAGLELWKRIEAEVGEIIIQGINTVDILPTGDGYASYILLPSKWDRIVVGSYTSTLKTVKSEGNLVAYLGQGVIDSLEAEEETDIEDLIDALPESA